MTLSLNMSDNVAGFVCTSEFCNGGAMCVGTHHCYYYNNIDGTIPIIIHGTLMFISLEGFDVYNYRLIRELSSLSDKTLNNLSTNIPSATNISSMKRRKMD